MLNIVSSKRIWRIAQFELIRLFLTKSGMLALGAFVTAWFLILYYLVSSAADMVSSEGFKDLAQGLFSSVNLEALLNWVAPELAIYWLVAVYIFPVFTIVAASDQTCADRTRGTLRFISLRATRWEILFGRFSGQVLIISLLILFTLIATLLMAIYRDSSLIFDSMLRSASLFINLIVVVLPYIALMTFFNSFIKSSRLVIVCAMLFFGILPLVFSLINFSFSIDSQLSYIIPGMQIESILSQENIEPLHYIIPLLQTTVYLFVANFIMKRSAL